MLDRFNLQLHPDEKVGMVGPNGSDKSTILKLITGAIEPHMGGGVKQKGLRIGYLPQEATFSGQRTVLEEVHTAKQFASKPARSASRATHFA